MLSKLLESFPSIPNSPSTGTTVDTKRPRALHVSKSFSRLDPLKGPLSRNRATTIQNILVPATKELQIDNGDIFERNSSEDSGDDERHMSRRSSKLPDDFDELPIELMSLTDRCVLEIIQLVLHPRDIVKLL